MDELKTLKKLVQILTHQRNVAFDNLAQLEATLIMEREAAAAKSVQDAGTPSQKKKPDA